MRIFLGFSQNFLSKGRLKKISHGQPLYEPVRISQSSVSVYQWGYFPIENFFKCLQNIGPFSGATYERFHVNVQNPYFFHHTNWKFKYIQQLKDNILFSQFK